MQFDMTDVAPKVHAILVSEWHKDQCNCREFWVDSDGYGHDCLYESASPWWDVESVLNAYRKVIDNG